MKSITIRTIPYKERDSLVDVITDTGFYTILVKGGQDFKCKNAHVKDIFSINEITLLEGNYKYPILKNYISIASLKYVEDDLDFYGSIAILQELINKCLLDEEKSKIYDLLLESINLLNIKTNSFWITLLMISKILKINGFVFEINKCSRCGGKSNIVDFSFNEGGFICSNCCEKKETNFTKNQMMLIRDVFGNVDPAKISNFYNKNDAVYIMEKLFIFILDNLSVTINSTFLIKN